MNRLMTNAVDCIVIGAGMAGISAAKQLGKKGLKVLLLEARDRIGGRINTLQPGPEGPPIERGAQWIHGLCPEHPMYTIIPENERRIDTQRINMFDKHGALIPEHVVTSAWNAVDALSSRMTEHAKKTITLPPPKQSIAAFINEDLEWNSCASKTENCTRETPCAECDVKYSLVKSIANIEAATLNELSVEEYAGDGFEGDDGVPLKGYLHVLNELLSDLKDATVLLNAQVLSVDYSGDTAVVNCTRGEFHARNIICTIPLGVLKETGGPEFIPQIPEPHQKAISNLGFGLLNKVVLEFESGFWPSNVDDFAFELRRDAFGLDPMFAFIVNFSQLYARRDEPQNTLVVYVAHDDAKWMEGLSDGDIRELILPQLTWAFRSETKPIIKSMVVTRWMADPFSRGSYSHLSTGSSLSDMDALASPISFGTDKKGTLVFAGEHTIRQHFATVHGAYLSGIRAAEQIA
ncbi:hypothetical protein HDU78_001259 [Chytriomyces hyalinus]|nr:hypothetical protein HDU78_001259 [Chytriomyces hyalinus]